MNRGDARVIERSEKLGLALEPCEPPLIPRKSLRQDLYGYVAAELGVSGAIDLSHAAGANKAGDLERAEGCAGGEGH